MPYLPLAREAGRIHVCAHRGHSVGAPENTLPALHAAAGRGADVAEIDVVLTRDDAIVLLHEAGIAVRVTMPRPKTLAARRAYGFDDEIRLAAHLAAGHIDVLASDDTSHIRGLVDSALALQP